MSNYEYFELKYLEEVNELFLNIRGLSDHYDLKLFQGSKNHPIDLMDFLFGCVEVLEEESEEEDELAYD